MRLATSLKQAEVTEAAAKQTAQSHEWALATTAIDPIADICFALPNVRFWGVKRTSQSGHPKADIGRPLSEYYYQLVRCSVLSLGGIDKAVRVHQGSRRFSGGRGASRRARSPAMPVSGFVGAGSPDKDGNRVRTFRRGLSETDCFEGQNV